MVGKKDEEPLVGIADHRAEPIRPTRYVTVDEILPYIGEFGRYQLLQTTFLCLINLSITFSMLITYFGALDSPWQCKDNSTICTLNGTFVAGNENYEDRCWMSRDEWSFSLPKEFSIVTYFDLFCDTYWLADLASSVYFVGWICGGWIVGCLADRYGRHAVLFSSTAVTLAGTLLSAFSPNIWVLIASRFLVGACFTGSGVQGYILLTEMVGQRHRATVGNIYWIFNNIAMMSLSLIAFYVREWKMLFIFCSAPYIFVLGFAFLVPESVRWLHVTGESDKAMRSLKTVAKWNKKKIPEEFVLHSVKRDICSKKPGISDLFKTKNLAKITLLDGYSWIACNMGFYGLNMAAGNLGGSLYLNFCLLMLVEVPANILAIFTCNKFGRKKTVIICTFLTSVACLSLAVIPCVQPWIIWRTVVAVVGKGWITMGYHSKFVWTSETYPTTLRSTACGIMLSLAPIGGSCAPWISLYSARLHESVPFVIIGLTTLIAAILMTRVPDTWGKATVEDEILVKEPAVAI